MRRHSTNGRRNSRMLGGILLLKFFSEFPIRRTKDELNEETIENPFVFLENHFPIREP